MNMVLGLYLYMSEAGKSQCLLNANFYVTYLYQIIDDYRNSKYCQYEASYHAVRDTLC